MNESRSAEPKFDFEQRARMMRRLDEVADFDGAYVAGYADAQSDAAQASAAPPDEGADMYRDLYLVVVEKWAAIVDMAGLAEHVGPDEVFTAIRGEKAGERKP